MISYLDCMIPRGIDRGILQSKWGSGGSPTGRLTVILEHILLTQARSSSSLQLNEFPSPFVEGMRCVSFIFGSTDEPEPRSQLILLLRILVRVWRPFGELESFVEGFFWLIWFSLHFVERFPISCDLVLIEMVIMLLLIILLRVFRFREIWSLIETAGLSCCSRSCCFQFRVIYSWCFLIMFCW